MKYTAKTWAKLLEKVERYLPRRFFELGVGFRSKWKHPWTVTMGQDRLENLTPFFIPGLVNSFPPWVEMEYKKAPVAAQLRVDAESLANDKEIDKAKPIRVYLDEGPTLPLNWRAFDPLDKDVVPPKFGNLPQSDIYATDIVIKTLRTSLDLTVTKANTPDFTGINVDPKFNVNTTFGFNIESVNKYVPPKSYLSAVDIAQGRFFDNPYEATKICTIFALKPPLSTKPIPDINWIFATSYNAYWNFAFWSPFKPIFQVTNRISFFSPLAGGGLQAAVILGGLLSASNEYSQAMVDFINRNKLAGHFISI
jgi:hypothetical protein